ncbi:MAG: gluconate 2-dehydrogenase subunit 3 family protein [Bryobacterales bacterium]|nr:gluconate 2-dehydrogenase subunit 3 family protein [Acidobacteriota bacterium]MCB9383700.1 gluconate 2-dehydrogenase subunit 3 family protein [Bryobacterales bacterium]
MQRRVILKLISAGFLVPAAQPQDNDYQPLFFSPEEMTALDRLTEILIPADEHAPGASAALVNRFVDVMVSEGPEAGKRVWRRGLEALDEEAQRLHGRTFVESSEAEQEAVVARMAENELEPTNELERFFRVLKRMTIDGYYTSKIGIHQELEYQGNTALAAFEGCTHPEHQQG